MLISSLGWSFWLRREQAFSPRVSFWQRVSALRQAFSRPAPSLWLRWVWLWRPAFLPWLAWRALPLRRQVLLSWQTTALRPALLPYPAWLSQQLAQAFLQPPVFYPGFEGGWR